MRVCAFDVRGLLFFFFLLFEKCNVPSSGVSAHSGVHNGHCESNNIFPPLSHPSTPLTDRFSVRPRWLFITAGRTRIVLFFIKLQQRMYKIRYYNGRVHAFFCANSVGVHELNNYTFYAHVRRTRHKAVHCKSLDDFVAPIKNRDYRTVIVGKLFLISHRNRYLRYLHNFITPTIVIKLKSVCSHPAGFFILKENNVFQTCANKRGGGIKSGFLI